MAKTGASMSLDDREQPLVARRLDELFRTVHPAGRGEYSYGEVAEAINKTAGRSAISKQYLWQLRTGKRAKASGAYLKLLADFFNVPVNYFIDEDADADDTARHDLLAAVPHDAVRDLALRAAGLSERSLAAIAAMIDNARAIEGLPDNSHLFGKDSSRVGLPRSE
jgi:ESX-1-secreted protein regulator